MASPVIFSSRTSLLAAVALCGLGVATTVLSTDSAWSSGLRGADLPGDVEKAIHLSEVFAHGLGAAAILLSVFWIAVDRRPAVWGAILLTLLAGTTANVMKGTVTRIRPHSIEALQELDAALGAEGSEVLSAEAARRAPAPRDAPPRRRDFWDSRQRSFPSGHAATAWGLAIGLSFVFPRGVVLFACFASLACLQRIFSGAHYPSDVLAGSAIAFSWALILLSLAKTRKLFELEQPTPAQQPPNKE